MPRKRCAPESCPHPVPAFAEGLYELHVPQSHARTRTLSVLASALVNLSSYVRGCCVLHFLAMHLGILRVMLHGYTGQTVSLKMRACDEVISLLIGCVQVANALRNRWRRHKIPSPMKVRWALLRRVICRMVTRLSVSPDSGTICSTILCICRPPCSPSISCELLLRAICSDRVIV